MSIEIRIHAETTQEALKELAEIAIKLSPVHKSTVQAPTTPTSAGAELEVAKNAENPTTAQDIAEPAGNAPASDVQTSPTASPTLVENDAQQDAAPIASEVITKKLTLEFVRAAGVEAARKHGKEAVKGILDSLGEIGMISMAPDKYEEFMRKLGELDA